MGVVIDTLAELDTGTTVHGHAEETGKLRRFRLRSHRNRKQVLQPAPLIDQVASEQLGERRRGDRRQRDGLGLLPRATTSEDHEHRAQLNKLGGLFLSGFGALIAGGSGSLLSLGSIRSGISGVVLGTALLIRGIYVIGKRDRRRRGRRKVRSKAESMGLVRSSSAPRRNRQGVVRGKGGLS